VRTLENETLYVNEKFKEALEKINLKIDQQTNIQHKCNSFASKEYKESLKEEIRLLKQKKKELNHEARRLME
jgi:hypothetical protein